MSDGLQPPNGETPQPEDGDEFWSRINAAREFYLRPENAKSIETLCEAASKWLIANEGSWILKDLKIDGSNREGYIRSGKWFHDVTDRLTDESVFFARRYGVECLVYHNGLGYILYHMREKGLILSPLLNQLQLKDLFGYRVMAANYQMIVHTTPISLVDLRDRFDYSRRTKETKLKPKLVLPAAEIGWWTVYKNGQGFGIKAGPVMKYFFNKTLASAMKAYEPKLKGN